MGESRERGEAGTVGEMPYRGDTPGLRKGVETVGRKRGREGGGNETPESETETVG